jgi:alkaline phosphatase
MKRRDLLRLGTLAGAAAVSLGPGAVPALGLGPGARATPPFRRGAIRNVIFFAYDGTGYEDFATADFFAREVVGRRLRYHDFLASGLTGSMIPASLLSWVTDSAAASSAWSTGRRIVNGALNRYPDGRDLIPILELARGTGRATGLVSTARATHATPAGWVAKVDSREQEAEIALQYLDSGTDVILGGGQAHFEAATRPDGRELYPEFEARGYQVVRDRNALLEATGSKLLGIFTPSTQHVAYEVDRRFQADLAPSLAEMTRAALDRLDDAEKGFVLQIEAGRIDHANHQNDPGAMVWDWIAADETLDVLLDFVAGRDDTLLIHAPDHDTGGGVTYGWGSRYSRTDPGLRTLGQRKASHEFLIRELMPERPSPQEAREVVRAHLGIPLDDAQAESVAAIVSGTNLAGVRFGHLNAHDRSILVQMAQVLAVSPRNEPDRPTITFATSNHTAGFVPVVLAGAGISKGNLGVIDNTDLFSVMTEALGIDFENSLMTAEEARAHLGEDA